MFNFKKEIKNVNEGYYQIKYTKTDCLIIYKSMNTVYNFPQKSINSLLYDCRVNQYQLILNTGTEIIITEQFYNNMLEVLGFIDEVNNS